MPNREPPAAYRLPPAGPETASDLRPKGHGTPEPRNPRTPLGLWARQFLYTCLLAAVAIALLALITAGVARQYAVRQLQDELHQEAQLVGEYVTLLDTVEQGSGAQGARGPGRNPGTPESRNPYSEVLQERIHRLGTGIDARLTVIDSFGTVLADSRAEPAQMENHSLRPEVIAALRDGWGQAIHRSRTLPEAMLYVARRVRTPQGRLLIVRASLDLREIRQWAAVINRRILLAAALLLVLALGSSLLFTRSVVHPVLGLQRAARRIADGDLMVRVPEGRRDELGALARAMNEMTGQLQKLFAAANSERGLLQAIVGSMTEAVVVLDRRRRIVLANPSFEQEFRTGVGGPGSGVGESGTELNHGEHREHGESGISDSDSSVTSVSSVVRGRTGPDGKFLWETLRSADLQDLVERVIREDGTVAAELRIGQKSFDATAVPLKGERNEIVVVLHDVTQLKALDKVKADLVTNVSHELRTPLTAIKGYAETLEDEVPQHARRFLEIIRRHTERLIALVNDLLVLSQLESGERQLEKEPADLAEIASDALKLLEKQIADKGLKAGIDAAPGLTRVRADRFLLEQAFINLLDNAVKYTASGGITVRLAPSAPNQVRIEIADTGIGIPAESLGRIFERFYVVDKNRSRELGGTGLGLAIVKRIVLAHNGTVTVESGLGKGTVFTILLPV